MKLKSLSQKDRYGNMFSFEFFEPDASIPMMMVIPDMADGYNGADTATHPGEPKGTDTVPAWLTPGENVVNAEASRLPGNQEKIDEMNEEGRAIQQAQGGPIPTYQAQGGTMPAANIDGNDFVKAAQAVGLSTDKSTLNKIVDLVNQGMSVTEAAKAVASKPVYSAGGQKITKRKMPNGKMGLWRGNTYLGMDEEKSSFLGDVSKAAKEGWEGWNPFNSEGGNVPAMYSAGGSQVPRPDGMLNSLSQRLGDRDGGPMYAAAGNTVPSWLTEDILDRLKMVESSGNPDAVSEVGAQGLYQIMPATAQQPGMNVPPLALEDIRDPVKSREFARNYLSGIAKANPDFTPEEVLTAYHSGAGNVRKAKDGTEALGPRGQAYAGKIMDNMSDPDKFGVTRRKVVGNVPAPTAAVPEPIDFSQYSDPVTGPRVPTQIAGSEDQRIRDEAILAESLANERTKIAAMDDAGLQVVPKPEADLGDPESTTLVPIDFTAPVKESQAAEAAAIKVMETGTRATNAAAAAEAERAKLKDLIENSASASLIARQTEKTKAANAEEIASKQENKSALATQEAQNKELAKKEEALVAEAKAVAEGVPPKPDDKPDDTKAVTNQKKNAAGMVMEQLGPVNEITLEGEAGINNLINSLPENPEAKSKFDEVTSEVGGWFKDTFSSMFSGPEIARMLVTYAGSRIMGYDHGNSLNYSMKNYVERIDAQEKQYQEDIRKDDYQDFTEASRKEFEKTRDYSVLKEKKTALTMVKPTGNSYIAGVGKVQRFEGSDGNEYVEYKGKFTPVSEVAELLEPWSENLNRKNMTDRFKSAFESATATANAERGLRAGTRNKVDYDDRVAIDAVKLASEAESKFREILRQNAVSVNDVPELQINVNNAISKFVNDTIDYKQSGGKGTKPNSIRAYINAETRSVLTGVPQFAMNGASENNMNKLDDKIKAEVRNKEGKRIGPKDEGYAEAYENLWSATWAAYRLRSQYPDLDSSSDKNFEELAEKKRDRSKDPADQWTAFTLWMSRTPASEVQAIIEQAKLDGSLDKLI